MAAERVFTLALRWLLLAASVWAAARVLPGVHLEGWGSTLAVGAILGFLNLSLRPVLVVLSCPVTVLTLGLFHLVINAALLLLTDWIAGWWEAVNFGVDGFWSALLGAIVISLVGQVLSRLVPPARIARELTGG